MNISEIALIVNTDLTDTSAEQLCEIGLSEHKRPYTNK